ncbi:hypothetical protein FF011L_12330 [Roseimaritima multifibrata]|uniref:Uncharacterized protein n=1 Tax=Roseimaritima multifibrata TaxID=1930274 RepID=A0A517MC70_9BACT|nr:hypothetical protein [Roseimaritima multifibrata]QDS92490.1 hypothetical protein FF011L_12330 [Roseimaritima multifibrata]
MQSNDSLKEQVSQLTGEVKVLRESVDELKTALEWAIRNARITVHFDETANSQPSQVAEPPPTPATHQKQLTLNFETQATFKVAEQLTASEQPGKNVLSIEDYKARTRAIWDAVNAWIIEFTPSIEFDAHELGVYEKIKPESQGSFSDEDQERLLKDDYALACGVAIAVEDASILMEDHGHADDAESLTRAYYLAIALKSADFDLEHYLPGFPVHCMERP